MDSDGPFMILCVDAMVHGWRARRLPFASPDANDHLFVNQLRTALGQLNAGTGALAAVYTSSDTSLADAENVLVYNLDMPTVMTELSGAGLRLERAVGTPPPAPLGCPGYPHHHIYERSDVQRPFSHSIRGTQIASFLSAALKSLNTSTHAGDVWWAISQGEVNVRHPAASEEWQALTGAYVLELRVHGVSAGVSNVVKPLTDGVVAAMHCHVGVLEPDVVERLAVALDVQKDDVRAALAGATPALGARAHLVRATANGVAWNPADDRCVGIVVEVLPGAEIRIEGAVGSARSRPTPVDRVRGCLLGGAIGDALGEPIEFRSIAAIRGRYGPSGVTGPECFDTTLRISDDTQMTLFTAEGLIRAHHRLMDKGIGHPVPVVRQAYLRWLATQQGAIDDPILMSGWLIQQPVLHARRAPGATCLSALMDGRLGTTDERLNDSKGCGGVMRVAPAGLLAGWVSDPFELGCQLGALTHGHPSGYLAAGFLAQVVADLDAGAPLLGAVHRAMSRLQEDPDGGEVARAVAAALALAELGSPSPDRVEKLGGGWVAEEALAIWLVLRSGLSHLSRWSPPRCQSQWR